MASIYNPLSYISGKAQSAANAWSNFTQNVFDTIFTTGDGIQKELFDDIVGRIPIVGQPVTRFKNNMYSKIYAWGLARNQSPSPKLLEYFNSTYGPYFNDNFFKYLEDNNKTHLYQSQYDWYKYQQSLPKLPPSFTDVAKALFSRNYTSAANQLVDQLSDQVDPIQGLKYIANRVSTDLAQPRKPSNLRGGLRNHTTPVYNFFTDYYRSIANNTNFTKPQQVIASNIPIPINNTIIPNTIANETTKFNSFLNQLINNNNNKLIISNMDTTPNQPIFYQDINPYTYTNVRTWPTNLPDISYYRPLTNRQKRRLYYKYGLNKINSNKNDTQSMVLYGRNKFPLTRLLNRRRQRARRNTQMRRYKTVNSSDSYVFDCYLTYNARGTEGMDGNHFSKNFCIRDLLSSCILWPQTAALYNQFKVTYLSLEMRQLLSYRYYINQPVIAVNCLYNANQSSSFTYEDVRSSSGAMVYHMEKNYFVYRHRFSFTQSPSPGLGKFTDLNKNNSSTYMDSSDADTYIFTRSNLPFKFDLSGLPQGTTDDLSADTPVFELHFKFWVKLKGKMQ